MGTRQSDPAQGLNAAVADQLEAERHAAHWTLPQLAEASGISYRTLQRILAHERNIDINVLAQMARAFRMEPEDVIAAAMERMGRPDYIDPGDVEAAREAAKSVPKKRPQTPRGDGKSSRTSRRTMG